MLTMRIGSLVSMRLPMHLRLLARWYANEQGRQRHQPPRDHSARSTHSGLSIAPCSLLQFCRLPPRWHADECRRECYEPPGDHAARHAHSRLPIATVPLLCRCGLLGGWNRYGHCWQLVCARGTRSCTVNARSTCCSTDTCCSTNACCSTNTHGTPIFSFRRCDAWNQVQVCYPEGCTCGFGVLERCGCLGMMIHAGGGMCRCRKHGIDMFRWL